MCNALTDGADAGHEKRNGTVTGMYDADEFFSAERPVTLKYAQRIQEQYSWQDDVLKVTTGIVHEIDKWRELEICNHFNCDLSEFREWLAKKQEKKPQTNADKIRKMDDAELAAWLFSIQYHERCDHYNPFPSKITAWVKWLKQETE